MRQSILVWPVSRMGDMKGREKVIERERENEKEEMYTRYLKLFGHHYWSFYWKGMLYMYAVCGRDICGVVVLPRSPSCLAVTWDTNWFTRKRIPPGETCNGTRESLFPGSPFPTFGQFYYVLRVCFRARDGCVIVLVLADVCCVCVCVCLDKLKMSLVFTRVFHLHLQFAVKNYPLLVQEDTLLPDFFLIFVNSLARALTLVNSGTFRPVLLRSCLMISIDIFYLLLSVFLKFCYFFIYCRTTVVPV